jgi:hypothetical protein
LCYNSNNMSSPEFLSVDELVDKIPTMTPEGVLTASLLPARSTNPFENDTYAVEQALAEVVGVDEDSHGARQLARSRTPAANLLRAYVKLATARPSGLWVAVQRLDAPEPAMPHFSTEWTLGFGGCGRGKIALKETVVYAPETQHPQAGKNRTSATVNVLARLRDGKIHRIENNPLAQTEAIDPDSTPQIRDNAIGQAFKTNGHLTGWRP